MGTADRLDAQAVKDCCATAYADPSVRWLLGDELHPGGAATTRRALDLAGVGPGDRLLDVASGSGASALLAASELSARVVGVEYGADAVRAAADAANAAGLTDRVSFVCGDAESLPVADGSFDAVLCECSLCTFPDQRRAVAELCRVLRPGGRLALCDVVLGDAPLPNLLHGGLALVACIGGALSSDGYRRLLQSANLRVETVEPVGVEVDLYVRGIEERLRGARLLGLAPPEDAPITIEAAIETARQAREAITRGDLGYSIFIASARGRHETEPSD